MKIRLYNEADLPRIISIYNKARKNELILAGISDAFIPLTEETAATDLLVHTVIVAEENCRVVGFAAYSDSTLKWLYVNPIYSGQGIGTSLAHTAISSITETGSRIVSVQVLDGNTPARRLYEKLGFTLRKTVPGIIPGTTIHIQVHCLDLQR